MDIKSIKYIFELQWQGRAFLLCQVCSLAFIALGFQISSQVTHTGYVRIPHTCQRWLCAQEFEDAKIMATSKENLDEFQSQVQTMLDRTEDQSLRKIHLAMLVLYSAHKVMTAVFLGHVKWRLVDFRWLVAFNISRISQ